MTVGRIGTANQYSSVLLDIQRAQANQIEAQRQVSTGKVGANLKDYADRDRNLIATQAVKARVDGMVDQLGAVNVKLDTQQLALETVSDTAASLKDAIGSALATGRADGLMNNLQAYFGQTLDALNSRNADGYVFAGGQNETKPVNITTLAQLATASPVDTIFQNGSRIATTRTDDTTSTQVGFLANAVGKPLMTAMQSIQQFNDGAGGPFDTTLTAAQTTFLETTYASLSTVASDAVNVTAQGGDVQSRVASALTAQTARQATLDTTLGDLTQVDMATAISRLTQAQTGVQASAQVFLSLKDMSLLNYLK